MHRWRPAHYRRSIIEYDQIGGGYVQRRRPDHRLARRLMGALGGATSVVNVGAGAGSYEPRDGRVVAIEPSLTMIRQRPPGAAPVLRACAEGLPLADASFEAALAVLTIHHWADWRAGLREAVRVACRRVVLFTWDPESEGFWLVRDYLPELLASDRRRFPRLDELRAVLGEIEVSPVLIPHDCEDGFLGAYWRRPGAYLQPEVRRAISGLAREESPAGLAALADDVVSGAWARRYRRLVETEELDLGYRLVTCVTS